MISALYRGDLEQIYSFNRPVAHAALVTSLVATLVRLRMSFPKIHWKSWLKRFLTEFRQEVFVPVASTDLVVGTTRLMDAPELVAQFLQFVAERDPAMFDTWTQFQNRFSEARLAPGRPLEEPPSKALFKLNQPQYIQQRTAYEMAQQRYRVAVQRHEKFEAEVERFRQQYENSPTGYIAFVDAGLQGSLLPFLQQPLPIPIQEIHRKRHTYISGGSGAGKSELLKAMIFHYLTTNPSTAMVVLDPHGGFADQVARFPESEKRLVYINPSLSESHTPRLNPFEVTSLSQFQLDIHRQQILAALGAVLGDQAALTPQMKSVLSPCVTALLKTKGAHIGQLKEFLGEEADARPLVERSLPLIDNPEDLDFFKNDFFDKQAYAPTKRGIRTRLHNFLCSPIFRGFLCGPSSFDFEKELRNRKLIVFNLKDSAPGEKHDSAANSIGRFVISRLLSVVLRRSEELPPIHFFLDEAHQYTVPALSEILAESRKFGLHLTLANQFMGQFNQEIRSQVKRNTLIKFTGKPEPDLVPEIAKLTETNSETVRALGTGRFLVHCDGLPGFLCKVRSDLIDDRHRLSERDWKRLKARQVERFYQPFEAFSPSPSEPASALPTVSQSHTSVPPSTSLRPARSHN